MTGRSKLSPALVAAAYAMGAAAMWPLIELIGAVLSRSHTPLQTVWLRYAAHSLVLLALVLPRAGKRVFKTQHLGLQLLRGFLMFVMPLAYLMGVAGAPHADVWSVFWLAPILILLAAPRLLGEWPGPVRWTAVVLGLVGALLVTGPDRAVVRAFVPGLIMAATLAGYVLLSRRLRAEGLSTSLFYTGVGALLPLSGLIPWIWGPVRRADWLVALALGVASLLFLTCLDRAAEYGKASLVAPLLYVVLPFEAGVTSLVRGHVPGSVALVGYGVVALAIVLVVFDRSASPSAALEVT